MTDPISIKEYGHVYVSIFALSIFEHEMSDVLKRLEVSSNKLVAGQDTDAYYLAAALKDSASRDDFHSKVLPSLKAQQEELIVERFNEAEAFRHLLAHSIGVLPSVQECRGGVRTLQRLLSIFKCDDAAARIAVLHEQLNLEVIVSEADPLVFAKFLGSSLLGKFERILSSWLQSVEASSASPFSLYGFTSDISFTRECERKPGFEALSRAVKEKRSSKLKGFINIYINTTILLSTSIIYLLFCLHNQNY
jgi:hypothetical protein